MSLLVNDPFALSQRSITHDWLIRNWQSMTHSRNETRRGIAGSYYGTVVCLECNLSSDIHTWSYSCIPRTRHARDLFALFIIKDRNWGVGEWWLVLKRIINNRMFANESGCSSPEEEEEWHVCWKDARMWVFAFDPLHIFEQLLLFLSACSRYIILYIIIISRVCVCCENTVEDMSGSTNQTPDQKKSFPIAPQLKIWATRTRTRTRSDDDNSVSFLSAVNDADREGTIDGYVRWTETPHSQVYQLHYICAGTDTCTPRFSVQLKPFYTRTVKEQNDTVPLESES